MEEDELILIGRAAELAISLAEREGLSTKEIVERALEHYGTIRRAAETSPDPDPK